MPRIAEYTAKIDKLQPRGEGSSAYYEAGRRIGTLASQAGADIERMGELKAKAIKDQAEASYEPNLPEYKNPDRIYGGGSEAGRGGGIKSGEPKTFGAIPDFLSQHTNPDDPSSFDSAGAAATLASTAASVAGARPGGKELVMGIDYPNPDGSFNGSFNYPGTDEPLTDQNFKPVPGQGITLDLNPGDGPPTSSWMPGWVSGALGWLNSTPTTPNQPGTPDAGGIDLPDPGGTDDAVTVFRGGH